MRKWTAILFVGLAALVSIYLVADYYTPRTGTPERVVIAACRLELKHIADAKALWAAEHRKTTNDIPTWADLVGPDRYLTSERECSRGGTYTIGRVGEPPTCSLPKHKL